MIKIIFSFNREVLQFLVDKKVIWYTDRKWKKWIRCIPEDKDFIMKIMKSRNAIPKFLIDLIKEANAGRSREEWLKCKNDEEVSKIIIKDAKAKGCKLEKIIRL